jgi:hypothetical protein
MQRKSVLYRYKRGSSDIVDMMPLRRTRVANSNRTAREIRAIDFGQLHNRDEMEQSRKTQIWTPFLNPMSFEARKKCWKEAFSVVRHVHAVLGSHGVWSETPQQDRGETVLCQVQWLQGIVRMEQ